MITFHYLTLFPSICWEYFRHSIPYRAVTNKKVSVAVWNPRLFAEKGRADKRPYGGGPGMVLEALPFLKAYERAKGRARSVKTIFLTPDGPLFTQEKAQELVAYKHLIFACGHYEGLDERFVEATNAERMSIGAYTVTGGELPALVISDAVLRALPGTLGNPASLEQGRTAAGRVYTRPEQFVWKGKEYHVPKVLRSGNHGKIQEYRARSRG